MNSDDIAPRDSRGSFHTLEFIDVGPAAHLSVPLTSRLNLVAGDNGVGKTFVLDTLWWCLTGTWADNRTAWPALEAREREPKIRVTDFNGEVASSVFDRTQEEWPRPTGWPPTLAPVLYVALDGKFSLWDPLRNRGRDAPSIYHFDSIWDRVVDERTKNVLCNGLIDDWRDWSQREGKSQFERFFAVIEALIPAEDEPRPGGFVKLSKHSAARVPQLHLRYGDVPITQLSAGMRRLIGVAYLLTWAWSEHVEAARLEGTRPAAELVLLMDEVEAHLHPKWQRMLLPSLLSAAEGLAEERLSVQIIATTHSPLVTASVEPIFDHERDQLLHLGYVGDKVRLEQIPWANQGDASGWLESPVFELGRATSKALEEVLAAAEAFLAEQPLPPRFSSRQEIDRELRRLLPSMDPFWLQWGSVIDEASQ